MHRRGLLIGALALAAASALPRGARAALAPSAGAAGEAAIAAGIHRQLSRLFVFAPDRIRFGVAEEWRDHLEAVRAGRTFRDDCDGFALTAARLALAEGVAPERTWLVHCRTERGENHLVCALGGRHVIDNRQRTAWPWSMLPYDWLRACRMDRPFIWREIRG